VKGLYVKEDYKAKRRKGKKKKKEERKKGKGKGNLPDSWDARTGG